MALDLESPLCITNISFLLCRITLKPFLLVTKFDPCPLDPSFKLDESDPFSSLLPLKESRGILLNKSISVLKKLRPVFGSP